MAPLLHRRYSVLTLGVAYADEDWVMRTSSSLNMLTPSVVKTETVSLSDVLPMLIRDVGKSRNVSACCNCAESLEKGSWVTYLTLLVLLLVTPTCHVNGLRICRPALHWSSLLM
jgi:hypothetical protein